MAKLRRPSGRWMSAFVIFAHGLFLVATNSLVSVFDDEATLIAVARRPIADTLALFVGGQGRFSHPPLSDVLLHVWLRWTNEAPALLRLPSIFFYCLTLWIIAETAQILWARRWTAVAMGVTWPTGYLLGRSAGWYTLSMLGVAALFWCYIRWRQTGHPLHWAGIVFSAVALVYTNYFGWVFFAVLGADLLLARPSRRPIGQFLAATALVAFFFLPLLRVSAVAMRATVQWLPPSITAAAGAALYFTHSLLVGEMAGPWTWPGVVAAAGGLGLFCVGLRCRESRRFLLLLAVPLAVGFVAGIVTGKRLAVFGPWLLLFLTSVAAATGRRLVVPLVGVAFAMGWLGILTGRYAGSQRYSEPWPEVTARVVETSRAGDVILCNHPSFYFYVSYLLPWNRERNVPWPQFTTAGRTFAPLEAWQAVISPDVTRIPYVRTTHMPSSAGVDRELLDHATRNFHLLSESRWAHDGGARLKNRLFPGVPQPEWRVHLVVWERTADSKRESAQSPAATHR